MFKNVKEMSIEEMKKETTCLKHAIKIFHLSKNFGDNFPDKLVNREISTECLRDLPIMLSGSGHYFNKNKKGFSPVLMEEMFNQRNIIKKEMLNLKIEVEKLKSKTDKEIEIPLEIQQMSDDELDKLIYEYENKN